MSHFFGVARVEFRVEFPGSASTCPGQVRRNFRQWSTGQLEKFFAEVVGLDDNLDIFFCWEEFTLARARQGSDAGQARPGFYAGQLGPRSHWQKKSVLQSSPHGRTGIFFLGRIPTLARARQGSDAGQVARQGGAPGVPRTCSSDMYSDMLKQLSACSKEPGESGGSAAWRGRNVNTNGTNGTRVGTCVEAL